VARECFLNGGGGAENIKYKFRFAPKFAYASTSNFNGSRVGEIPKSF